MHRTIAAFEEEIRAQLHAASDEVHSSYLYVSAVELGWTPEPGRWSVAECLQHLTLTNRAYIEALDAPLNAARRRLSRPREHFRGGRFGGWFARQVGPDGGFKAKAPKVFHPGIVEVPEGVPEDFLRSQKEIEDLLDVALTVDLDGVRVRSPVTGLIRLRLGDVFRIVCAHTQRHLRQARRVTDTPGFPEP